MTEGGECYLTRVGDGWIMGKPSIIGPSGPSDSPMMSLWVQVEAEEMEMGKRAAESSWAEVVGTGEPQLLKNQTPSGGSAVKFDGDDHFDQAELKSSAEGDLIIAAVLKPDQISGYHNVIDDDDSNRPLLLIDNRDPQSYEANFGVGGDGPHLPATNSGTDGWDIIILDSKSGTIYFNSGSGTHTAPAIAWAPE